MTVSKGRLLTTAAAVRHAEKHGLERSEIARVTVDGKEVDVEKAERALNESHAKAVAHQRAEDAGGDEKPANVFKRVAAPVIAWTHDHIVEPSAKFLDAHAPVVKTWLEKGAVATKELALANPEDIKRAAVVHIETKDGRRIEIPVVVRDEALTRTLLAISTTVGSVGLFPFFGNFVQAGAGLASLVASCATFLARDRELTAGLLGMAKKHVAMGLIGFIPVIDAATALQPISDGVRLAQLESGKAGEVVCGAAAIEGARASSSATPEAHANALTVAEIA